MRYINLQEAFETEVGVVNDGFAKPTSTDIEYFLNAALDKFTKTRYSKINIKGEAFEQSQKRIDDLRTLVTAKSYDEALVAQVSNKEYNVTIPSDYLILLGSTAWISPATDKANPCWKTDSTGNYILKDTDPIEGTIDTVDQIKGNSLSEYHLHYCKARPIKLLAGNKITLYTDGQYRVSKFDISYLRKPQYIDIHSNPFGEYIDMPEHTHLEIVKIAAQLYLENQANPRYQSYLNETSTME